MAVAKMARFSVAASSMMRLMVAVAKKNAIQESSNPQAHDGHQNRLHNASVDIGCEVWLEFVGG